MALRVRMTALVLAASATVLGACGDTDSDEDSPTAGDTTTADAGSDLPDCAEVWQEGSDLPADYEGCSEEGTEVAPELIDCSSGQRIVTYDDRFWAVPGNVVQAAAEPGLTDDAGYQEDMYSCRA